MKLAISILNKSLYWIIDLEKETTMKKIIVLFACTSSIIAVPPLYLKQPVRPASQPQKQHSIVREKKSAFTWKKTRTFEQKTHDANIHGDFRLPIATMYIACYYLLDLK